MMTTPLGDSGLDVPVLAVGCMRIWRLDARRAAGFADTAIACGLNFFDHADVYGRGDCERIFARALRDAGIDRGQVILQSKCGIRDGVYDFSREHILASVDGILGRLETDHLDVLVLHRPDALFEPDEVADAFDRLHRDGKVRHFGVSNQNPTQMVLLQNACGHPLVVNQIQLGLGHTGPVDRGLCVNTLRDAGIDRDDGVLDYCRLNGMCVQPWSPLQISRHRTDILSHPDYPELRGKLTEIAEDRGVTPSAVALAWLLRLPGSIQPVIGTTRADRLRELAQAPEVALSRDEWYALYRAARPSERPLP